MDIEEKRKLLKKLRQLDKIEQDNTLKNFEPTLIQKAFLLSKAKVRVVEGGNRPGKTLICTVDTLIQMTGIVPDSIKGQYPKKFIRKGNYWASSRTAKFSRGVAKPKIEQYLPKRLFEKFHEVRSIFYLKDGQELGLKSMEEGVIGYEGDSRLQIWMDEEHSKEVYKAAFMRTVDCAGRLVMSFTPVEGLTWAYKDLYLKAKRFYYTKNKHGVKEEVGLVHTPEEIKKLKDRELLVRENTSEDADPNIEVFQFTIYDNPYLPDVEIQNTENEHKNDMVQYQARILGIFAKLSERQVYSVPMLLKGQANAMTKFDRGDIEQGKFVSRKDGRLTVFKKKKSYGNYVIGADIAEGLEIGDYSCAQVLDHNTCEQVAVWHGKLSPEQFTLILLELGRYYNYAWLVPERNFHGFGVVNRIRDQKYKRLFCDDSPDLRTDKKSEILKYGWETNARTKPLMVQTLGQFLSENHIKVNDTNTWDELMTYVYHNNGKTGALKGCHDDRAVALMIALQGFLKRRPGISPMFINKSKTSKTTSDPYTGY